MYIEHVYIEHARIQKVFQRGFDFENVFFLVDVWIRISLKSGQYRSASETPFKWRFAGGPIMPNIEFWLGSFVIFQGIRISIAKKPFIFVISQGGVRTPCPPPPPPSGSAHVEPLSNQMEYLISIKGVNVI